MRRFGYAFAGLAMAIALAGGGYYVQKPSNPGGMTANFWVDTSGGTCARSAVATTYQNNGTECSSIDTAYQDSETSCGDVIGIESNFATEQTISERTALSSCSSWVVFKGHNNPSIDAVCLGNCSGSAGSDASTDGPDHIELRNFTTRGIVMFADSDGVLVDSIDGGTFAIEGPINITIQNSDWGPCPSSFLTGPYCYGQGGNIRQIRIYANDAGPAFPTYFTDNITIKNNTIHDFDRANDPDDHWECMFIAGGTDVTIDGNKLWNCHTSAMAFGDEGSDAHTAGTWLIQNNWFADGGHAFKFGGLPYDADPFVGRYNSFGPGESIYNDEAGSPAAGTMFFYANVIGATDAGCITNASYDFNVYLGTSGGCGSNISYVGSLPYVNTNENSTLDYHLAGAETTAADNKVTATTGLYALNADIDAQSRPQDSTTRDAGSDER